MTSQKCVNYMLKLFQINDFKSKTHIHNVKQHFLFIHIVLVLYFETNVRFIRANFLNHVAAWYEIIEINRMR